MELSLIHGLCPHQLLESDSSWARPGPRKAGSPESTVNTSLEDYAWGSSWINWPLSCSLLLWPSFTIILLFNSLLSMQGDFSLWTLTCCCHFPSWWKNSDSESSPLDIITPHLIDAFDTDCTFSNLCDVKPSHSAFYLGSPLIEAPFIPRTETRLCFPVLLSQSEFVTESVPGSFTCPAG